MATVNCCLWNLYPMVWFCEKTSLMEQGLNTNRVILLLDTLPYSCIVMVIAMTRGPRDYCRIVHYMMEEAQP